MSIKLYLFNIIAVIWARYLLRYSYSLILNYGMAWLVPDYF